MNTIRIFLCGDVMIGRGIDQILAHPNQAQLYESYVKDAREYVFLAEAINGKITYPVAEDYIWGAALDYWKQFQPRLKIINLETAVTQHDEPWPDKGIHYRMHPLNAACLSAAGIDICTLANNHSLDWKVSGLRETLNTLQEAGIHVSGAGENLRQAMQPAIFELDSNKRILVFSAGLSSSGIPAEWAASAEHPGIYYLPDLSSETLNSAAENIRHYRTENDLVILSLHAGSNWGYEISEKFRAFAHALIDHAQIDVLFGHSSHHPRSLEIYHEKLILYGCGDFINDYEGISGHEEYRGDLSLMYFLDFDEESLQLKKLTLVPLQMKQFKLQAANQNDAEWLLKSLNGSASFSLQLRLADRYFVYRV